MRKDNKYAGTYDILVLDTKYDLFIDNDPSYLDSNDADGLTDDILKTIHIKNVFKLYDDKKFAEEEFKRILRHELIHAFIHECGLTENTSKDVNWAVDEGMTDFWALQYYKIGKLFEDAYSIIPEIKKKTYFELDKNSGIKTSRRGKKYKI